MPRTNVSFIQSTTGPNLIPIDEIPQDVKDFVEQAYEQGRKSDGRVHAEYATENELTLEFRQMASYCSQRKPMLKIRKSPTRNLPANVMEFRVTADIEANGAANAKDDPKANQGQKS